MVAPETRFNSWFRVSSVGVAGVVTRGRPVSFSIHALTMAIHIASAHAGFGVDLPARHGEVVGLHVGRETHQVCLDVGRRRGRREPLAVYAPAILGVAGAAVTMYVEMATQAGMGRAFIA